jgi:hypothetical protein
MKFDSDSTCVVVYHRNPSINRKGTYILADIHGMNHFCPKLAPQPYNKPESCVSKIHTPMMMVWLVMYRFLTQYTLFKHFRENFRKNTKILAKVFFTNTKIAETLMRWTTLGIG